MRKRLFPALALVSLVSCGGGSKSSGTAPTGDELEATPVQTETAAETETETAAKPETAGTTCAALCDRILACAVEMGGQEPTEAQLAQAVEQCRTQCAKENPDKLDAGGKCAADNPDSCPGLFECLQPLQSGS